MTEEEKRYPTVGNLVRKRHNHRDGGGTGKCNVGDLSADEGVKVHGRRGVKRLSSCIFSLCPQGSPQDFLKA